VSLLVHGIVRAGDGGAVSSVAEEGVDVVVQGDVAAVASEVEGEEVLPTRAELLRHTRVLEALAEERTVLPMRFGIVVPDDQTLREGFLASREADLLATLGRLDGHAEFRLRGTYDEAAVITEVLRSDRRAARLRGRQDTESKMELGERIVAGIEARRAPDASRVVEALVPPASASSEGAIGQPLDAFTLSFLLAHQRRDEFDEAVDRLGDELAPVLTLELVGPVPPFSFVEEVSTWA
jgi:hypothetical protein